MNNKSTIQLQLDYLQSKGDFARELHSILEHYNVQDTVFEFCAHRGLHELSNGYFVESKIFDNLDDAVREMNSNQALRIVESSKFIIGDVFSSLSDCPEESHIFNIEYLEDVC